MNSNNNNNNILNRIKKLFSDIFKILRETVKFNDDKINHNESRYDRIDMLIKKYKINKVLD